MYVLDDCKLFVFIAIDLIKHGADTSYAVDRTTVAMMLCSIYVYWKYEAVSNDVTPKWMHILY